VQYFVKQRATETGDVTMNTPAIDVGDNPLLVFELIAYRIAGTSEQITAQLQSSNDMDTWADVIGADATLAVAGSDFDSARAFERPYGRYVRFEIVISGTVTEIEYSLVLNTYPSS